MTLPDSFDLFLLPGIGLAAIFAAWLHVLLRLRQLSEVLHGILDVAQVREEEQDKFNRQAGKLLQQLEAGHLEHARVLREHDDRYVAVKRMLDELEAAHLGRHERPSRRRPEEYTHSRSPLAGAEEEAQQSES